jgi:hypothetical protein
LLLPDTKSIIKYAIELDIDYIETFLGYEGDNVLKITTRSEKVIGLIKSYLENMGLKYKYEYELSGKNGPGYSIYVGIEDASIFKLKRD